MGRPVNTARKEEIMQSSLKVFGRQTTWDTSLNELARQLKTSTRMLVHHFETREKLVHACKQRLRQKLSEAHNEQVQSNSTWIGQILWQWERALAGTPIELRKLQVLSSLQSSAKTEMKENALYIENLRELLPSRIKKFAEEIFIYQQGLTLQVMTGRSQEHALQALRVFLKRLER